MKRTLTSMFTSTRTFRPSAFTASVVLPLALILNACDTGGAEGLEADPASMMKSTEASAGYAWDEYSFEDVLNELGDAYTSLDAPIYRFGLFALYHELRTLDDATILSRLEGVVEVANARGGDGLEPLLIAYADAIAQGGDGASQEVATAILSQAKITYVVASPNAGLTVPIGLATTAMAVDMRADAVRALATNLLSHTASGSGPVTFAKLGGISTEDLCALEAMGTTDRGVPIGEWLQSLDDERQDNCAKLGTPGQGKGDISGTYGTVISSACIDFMPVFVDNSGILDQIAQMEGCLGALDENPTRQSSGSRAIAPAIVAAGVVLAGGALGYTLKEAWEERKRERELDNERFKADVDLVLARGEAGRARAKRYDAVVARNEAQESLDDANAALKADPKNQDLQDDAAQAQKDLDKAEEELEEAEEAVEEAEKKEREADAAKVKADGVQDSFDMAGVVPDECLEISTGGIDLSDPVQVRKLAEDWATMKGKYAPLSNPNPEDDPRPSDLGGHTGCAGDTVTSTGVLSSACDGLVMCEPDDPHCGCVDVEEVTVAESDAWALGAALCINTQCADGETPTPVGATCVCENDEELSGGEARPPQPPFRPSNYVMDELFGGELQAAEEAYSAKEFPLDAFMLGVLQESAL